MSNCATCGEALLDCACYPETEREAALRDELERLKDENQTLQDIVEELRSGT